MRYRELNSAFRSVLELRNEEGERGEDAATDVLLQQAIDLFLKCADADRLSAPPQDTLRKSTIKGTRKVPRKKSVASILLTSFTELKTHTATANDARSLQLRLTAGFSGQAAEALLLAWLILRETSLDPVSRGLDYTLRKFLQRDGDPEFSSRAIELLSALLEWWRSDNRCADVSHLKLMQRLFTLEACQAFVLHHESDGIEWFNKERFEELCEWVQH